MTASSGHLAWAAAGALQHKSPDIVHPFFYAGIMHGTHTMHHFW